MTPLYRRVQQNVNLQNCIYLIYWRTAATRVKRRTTLSRSWNTGVLVVRGNDCRVKWQSITTQCKRIKWFSCFRSASGRNLAYVYCRVWQRIFFWIGRSAELPSGECVKEQSLKKPTLFLCYVLQLYQNTSSQISWVYATHFGWYLSYPQKKYVFY